MTPSSTRNKISYLIRLIDDRDEFVRNRVKDQLIEIGEDAIPFLEIAAKTEDLFIKSKALETIQAIIPKQLQKKFSQLSTNSTKGHWDLEAGVILLAKFGYPDEDADVISQILDQLATEASDKVRNKNSPEDAIKALTKFLFFEKGFASNKNKFFDPDNTYFSRVLERKKGLPITLSALCVFLGQRLDLPVVGIGLPGRYIVKYDSLTKPIYFDPFDSGRILSEEDCAKLVESMGYHFEVHHLVPATHKETLTRMMNNLIVIYNKSNQLEKTSHLANFIQALGSNSKNNSPIRPH